MSWIAQRSDRADLGRGQPGMDQFRRNPLQHAGFPGTTEDDQLSWLMGVKGKLMENETLAQQADSNQKEQFDNSPALKTAIMDAIIEALDAHSAMSRQALGSQEVQADLKAALMGPGRLYEELRERAA